MGTGFDSSNVLSEAAPSVHLPVLAQELIAGLGIQPGGRYLDATVGGGGHSELILAAFPDVRLVVIDRDGEALEGVAARLGPQNAARVEFWQGNYADFSAPSLYFDGIIADLGISSLQLDRPERGFSFQAAGPLDMRMDSTQSLTAAEIVNSWPERELADLIYEYGEERFSRRIARRIVENRPWQSTTELAEAIRYALPPKSRYGKIHPATRTFQALRIAVNDELGSLERFLAQATTWLAIGGKLGVISFHSLEDRRVKQHFRSAPQLAVLTKKPLIATAEEQAHNPRARSAKLRFAQKC
ncbi:MAG: 16S rRNA (cytosine(1402)-N(4))-methyltransferase RsmH [Chloroflexaceae bacterium]|nr:16S rRNA (cytosine(1402)-N(4))-methyltransferase RsmH [Chloroflexaceae bacterium]